jgi:hypothetical protein
LPTAEECRNYVVVLPCGCLCAAAHIDPEKGGKELLREVAKWLRSGDNVQQMSIDDIRSSSWGCDICKPKRRKDRQVGPRQGSLNL